MKRTFLKAAINGRQAAGCVYWIPKSPNELLAESRDALTAGADAIHFHVYNEQGQESLRADDVARCLDTLREGCPGIRFGISSGIWIANGDAALRLEHARAWSAFPDFVSVNFYEPGSVEFARLLMDREIGVEAGLNSREAAANFLKSEPLLRCERILLEPTAVDPAGALREGLGMLDTLTSHIGKVPILLHGYGLAAWPLLKEAGKRGLQARIGLEDTQLLSNEKPAANNAQMIAEARQILSGTAQVSW